MASGSAVGSTGKSATTGKKEVTTHFLVHGKGDSVGVMAADVSAGQKCTGWNMETDETLSVTANQDIPLGHKIALVDVPQGGTITKYGCPIGKTTKTIKKGDHVHIHNLKTARW